MKRWQALLALFVIVVIWGTTFIVVHDATRQWNTVAFVALRFLIASASVVLWALPELRRWRWADWRAGLLLGGLLFAGFVTQALGLSMTSASRGGFLTGLNVVLVPLFSALIWRERIRGQIWLGVALVVGGLWVLSRDTQPGQQASLLGDALVLVCAVMFAGHIIAVGKLTKGRSMLALNAVQLSVVALLALGASLLFEDVTTAPPAGVWWAALYLGLIATALIIGLQLAAQRVVSPTHTALIFVLEPVFAALFAIWFGDEQLSRLLLAGGGLMIAGIVLAEAPPIWQRRPAEPVHETH